MMASRTTAKRGPLAIQAEYRRAAQPGDRLDAGSVSEGDGNGDPGFQDGATHTHTVELAFTEMGAKGEEHN